MEPFTKALEVVAQVMRDGAATHPDNDWVRRSPEYHLSRAEEHLRHWRDGDQLQDHVSHAVTRFANGLNLTRAGVMGQPVVVHRRQEFFRGVNDCLPVTQHLSRPNTSLHSEVQAVD